MPIFEEVEEEVQCPEENAVKVRAYPDVYRGIAIDTKYVPRSSMLNWINGSNWNVTYFSQVLREDQEPTPLALHREPAYQQYQRIIGIDIKVNQPLDISQSEDVRTFSVTGSGHTYPSLVANFGDMFFGNIGDGRIGLFTVTSARRETFLRDSTYAIDWKMVGFVTAQQIANLEEKSIMTYYWSSANLLNGCSPYVTEQEQKDNEEFAKMREEIIRRYVGDFFSIEHSVFLVPDQLFKTYDHFVTKTLLTMLETSRFKELRRAKLLNVQSEPIMKQPTIWDALIRQDLTRFCGNTEKAHLVSTRISRWRPELQAIGYTGIAMMVYPIGIPTDIDSYYDGETLCRPEGIPYQEGVPRRPRRGPYVSQKDRDDPWFKRIPPEKENLVEAWKTPQDIKPVTCDDYYVFSEDFYYEDAKFQSKLEMLTWQMIKCEALDRNQLRAIVKCCLEWDNLERFYYHPVLIALLGYSKRKS